METVRCQTPPTSPTGSERVPLPANSFNVARRPVTAGCVVCYRPRFSRHHNLALTVLGIEQVERVRPVLITSKVV